MNPLKFFALVGIFLALMLVQPTAAFRLNQQSADRPHYVVIGAFAYYKNATKFTRHVIRDLHLDAKFELNPSRKLYYVYVLSTADREVAINEAKRLRSESELKDTWVYFGEMGKQDEINSSVSVSQSNDINPVTQTSIDNVQPEDQSMNESEPITVSQPLGETASTSYADPALKNKVDNTSESKHFIFQLYRSVDNDTVQGEVDVIDTEHSKKLASYKGNVPVKIAAPKNKTGNVSLLCEVFGYRKVQREIDYNNPAGEGIEANESGAIEIPFELIRLQKGDIAVMYNVYFFKDAGIMRPESRYEINNLLTMLKENPNYKIKIHGHTNGKAAGKIISMDRENGNFFSLTNTHEGIGSAKKLSEERAAIIRDYLISNGIDTKRMQIKAWGGKRNLHDKHSTRANENVRVEIEILED